MSKNLYALPCLNKEGGATMTNPCKVVNCKENPANPDPYVIRFKEMYYSYSTGHDGVKTMYSRDLVHWTYHGLTLQTEGETDFWAPSVLYRNGIFYMYYSSCNSNSFEFMKVATSDNPLGPFVYEKTLMNCFSIDTHAVLGEDGHYYLFYCTDHYCGTQIVRPGTSVQVDRLTDMFTLSGESKLILQPTIDQEISGQGAISPSLDWHTVEGPFYIRHNGRDYLMYSGNAFGGEDYFIGYAVSTRETSDCAILNKKWTKFPDDFTYSPFSHKNSKIEGTGHNSVVKAPNLVDDWCIYHGRFLNRSYSPHEDTRIMLADRILWDNDEMWFAGPSWTEQDAPAIPTFYDFFGEGLEQWEIIGGIWKTESGAAVQESGDSVAALVSKVRFRSFVYECWVQSWFQGHGNCYGIYASYEDTHNYMALVLYGDSRRAEVLRCRNGVRRIIACHPLEKDFNPYAWHAIRAIKSGGQLTFFVDGLRIIDLSCSLEEVRVGVVTRLSGARFGAITVTHHVNSNDGHMEDWMLTSSGNGTFDIMQKGIRYFPNRNGDWGCFTYAYEIGRQYEAELELIPQTSYDNFSICIEPTEDIRLTIQQAENGLLVNGETIPKKKFLIRAPLTFHIRRREHRLAVLFDRVCIFDGKTDAPSCIRLSINTSVQLNHMALTE